MRQQNNYNQFNKVLCGQRKLLVTTHLQNVSEKKDQ